MGLDLVVLTPGSARDFDKALRVYAEDEEATPDDPDAHRLALFASELDREYGTDNWPFAGDPIQLYTHVLLTVAPERWTEVVPGIVRSAHRHGLVVLDPQEKMLFPPGRRYEVSVSESGVEEAKSAQHHKNTITAAARKILGPMGIVQRGTSNMWFDDRSWWTGLIEFQPSSYGSRELNVAVQWLWDTQEGRDVTLGIYHYPKDLDISVDGYIEYESDEQFAPLVENMVRVGAERAVKYRRLLPTVESAARLLAERENVDWDINAGIAHGILGEPGAARRRFQRYLDHDDSEVGQRWRGEWMDARAERVRVLLSKVEHTGDFRALIAANVRQVREAVNLDPEIELPF